MCLAVTPNAVGISLIMKNSPETEEGRFDDEKQVPLTITRAFELGKTVITQQQWIEVMETTPWKAADEVADEDEDAEPEGDN